MAVPIVILAILGLIFQAAAVPSDPVARLEDRIQGGEAMLEFNDERGYLESLLHNLNVSIASQTLVFSKTSLQANHISPSTPRALYFNDDVYVAWVPGSSLIEVMAIHPQYGSIFYLLPQEREDRPGFIRSTGHECSVCHFARESPQKFVPRLLFDSVIPDAAGGVEGTFPIPTTDRSPFEERWGGWYVTGTHGSARHLGNVVHTTPVSILGSVPDVDLSRSANLTDLRDRFDTTRYLSSHSDIVALMVLAHQVDVHNRIALAGSTAEPVAATAEPLVKALLFSGAAPLPAAIEGSTSFAAEFAALGPRDSSGRSLRDFNLKTRLFEYPLSYVIYSRAFNGMPPAVKGYVYRRLGEILNGQDKSPDFAHISPTQRTTILQILRQTLPDAGL